MGRKGSGAIRPLFLKLSPDLTSEARKIAVGTAVEAGFSGIIASNTSRRRDFPAVKDVGIAILSQEGGLSGAPLREEAVQVIQEIRALIDRKHILISVGGLGGPEDARARLDAGANLLQVYTEFVYSGLAYPRQIARALAKS